MQRNMLGMSVTGILLAGLLSGCTAGGGSSESMVPEPIAATETHEEAGQFLPEEYLTADPECEIDPMPGGAADSGLSRGGLCVPAGEPVGIPDDVPWFIWSTGQSTADAVENYSTTDVFRYQEPAAGQPLVQVVAGNAGFNADDPDAPFVELEIYYPQQQYLLSTSFSEEMPQLADPAVHGEPAPLWADAIAVAEAYGFLTAQAAEQ